MPKHFDEGGSSRVELIRSAGALQNAALCPAYR